MQAEDTGGPDIADGVRSVPSRLLRWVAVAGLPILVALLTVPTAFGGTALPWDPQMADLDVYRRAGQLVLTGGDIYAAPDGMLPFVYPPFAALLAVPLAVPPAAVAQIGWVVLDVLALLAVLHRLGLAGWVLCLVTTGAIWFVEPVKQTLAYGQLGIVLVALVLLDLVPGPRMVPARRPRSGQSRFARWYARWVPVGRRLPTGALTGIGVAVKLTPAIFVPFLLLARRRWASIGAFGAIGTFAGAGLLAALLLPLASIGYWVRLVSGDGGTDSYHYLTNQGAFGTWLRLVGLGGWQSATGMLLAAVCAAIALWAGVLLLRRGSVAAAVCVVGVGSLLASPISWLHHFVWVVPLGVLLIRRAGTGFSDPARVVGWLFVGWVAAAPFMMLPAGSDAELSYRPWQLLLCSMTPVLGLAFLLMVVSTGRTAPASAIRTARSDFETWSYAEVSGVQQPTPDRFRSPSATDEPAGGQSHDASTGGDDGRPETAQP